MEISFQTERLILKTLPPAYNLQLLQFYSRNRKHFEPWEPDRAPNFYTLQYQKLTLAMEQQLLLKSKILRLWIFEKNYPNTIIGSVNFYNIVYDPFYHCQIGYKLDKDHTGKGYASEAVAAAIKFLLRRYPQIHRIEANIMPCNHSSLKLITKLGFIYEGTSKSSIRINHKWEDHCKYVYFNPKV